MANEKSDKSILLTAFNTQFYDFLDDIESVFMNDHAIKRAKIALILIKDMILWHMSYIIRKNLL